MRRRQSGFNIIELMVTIVILGIMIVAAAPSLGEFIDEMRLTSRANDTLAFLNYARSESSKRGSRVTVCVSSTQATCDTAGTDWAVGVISFIDTNANGQVDAGETILRVMDAMPTGFVINATTLFATAYYFDFRPSGAASSQGTLRLCRPGRLARDISVSAVGRASATKTAIVCP